MVKAKRTPLSQFDMERRDVRRRREKGEEKEEEEEMEVEEKMDVEESPSTPAPMQCSYTECDSITIEENDEEEEEEDEDEEEDEFVCRKIAILVRFKILGSDRNGDGYRGTW